VNWNNLNPGVHKYWVKLDSTNAVVELSEGDNVGTGTVFINPNQSFVPVVSRNQEKRAFCDARERGFNLLSRALH
jgi:hypothetical protein